MDFVNKGNFGFDISYGNGYPPRFPVTDFLRMREFGAKFVICKASQADFRDPSFQYNWSAAKGILPRMSYHYYDNYSPPRLQAERFWNTVSGDLEGICWLDLEDARPGDYLSLDAWYNFCERFKTISGGHELGIYVGYYYFLEHTQQASWSSRNYFKQFKLWMPSWGTNSGTEYLNPKTDLMETPYPWTECYAIQTGTPVIGSLAGVSSKEIDFNIINGDFGMPTGDTGMNTITFRATIGSMVSPNYRTEAGMTGLVIGQIPVNSSVEGIGSYVIKDGYSWIHIVAPVDGWLAVTSNILNILYNPAGLDVDSRPLPLVSFSFTDRDGNRYTATNIELKPQ